MNSIAVVNSPLAVDANGVVRRFYFLISLGLMFLLSALPGAQAQKASRPQIGFAYPAGGRQGATFQVTVGGQQLNGCTDAYVSGSGVRATVIAVNRPMGNKEMFLLRDELKELQQKKQDSVRPASNATNQKPWTDADEKRVAEIRVKLESYVNPQQLNRAIAETVTLQITIAPGAAPGERELRLRSPLGLSNPRVFCVGQLPEFSRKLARVYRDPKESGPSADSEMTVTLPATVNGQIMPGAVNRWRFQATKGQGLVIVASARQLIPYLSDAVPGWFQATLALFDAKGHELAYDDDFRFNPDPVLHYQIPADGEYVVEIKDSIYRGREDFVYRISISELPFITSIFPLGGSVDVATSVELRGWNLPTNTLTVDENIRSLNPVFLSVRQGNRVSNRVPFRLDGQPQIDEQEPNNLIESAQAVTLPVIVNGRVNQPGDVDVFRFDGHAGEEIIAEVTARRLNSPLDSVLRLTDADDHQIAFNDDHEDQGSGLETHHADSYIRFKLPTNGTYFVHLGDTQRKGGSEYGYCLSLSAPQPDFALRVTPSSVNFRNGASVTLTAFALRKDGFTNAINLFLVNAPTGMTLTGGRIPAETNQVKFTLTAPTVTSPAPFNLTIKGRAQVMGQEVIRTAIPAEDMMQAFAYRHLVPAQEFKGVTTGKPARKSKLKAGPGA